MVGKTNTGFLPNHTFDIQSKLVGLKTLKTMSKDEHGKRPTIEIDLIQEASESFTSCKSHESHHESSKPSFPSSRAMELHEVESPGLIPDAGT